MRAAFYESDITPPLGCFQSGYGFERIAEDVFDKIYSKALVLEDNGSYAVLIAVDLCEYHKDLHDKVAKRIEEYTGIPSERVCIHATHAHLGAPVIDNPQINCYADAPYKDVFYRLVADSAILAYKRLGECKAYFGSVEVSGIAHCRCAVTKDGIMRGINKIDPDTIERFISEPDHSLPVLFFERDGKKIGALYTFACHQDTVREPLWGYSGDYSSAVSDCLKEEYGSSFISIYMAAPCGDINTVNPFAKTEEEKRPIPHTEIGRRLADGIKKASENASCIGEGISVAKELVEIRKRKYSPEEFTKLASSIINRYRACGKFLTDLVYYQRTDKEDFTNLYIQVIKIGELGIFVYPGEMFCTYGHRTKASSPFKYTMVVENSNSFGGYIPTPECFGEHSLLYETIPAFTSFAEKDSGEIMYGKIIELAGALK